MSEIRKLACPKCRNTTFEVYLVVVKNFFFDGAPLTFTMQRCTKCGWQTHPTDSNALRKLIVDVLKGKVSSEGFVYAEVNVNE